MTHDTHLMIDLETLGTKPGSTLLAIGAVSFTRESEVGGFYEKVDISSCRDAGLTICPDTLKWWVTQDPAVFAEQFKGAENLWEVLHRFTSWVNFVEPCGVWGNGASFDLTLIEAVYDKLGLGVPWGFRQHRCFRTVRAMFPNTEPPAPVGDLHHAQDDARHQVRHLQKIAAENPALVL